MEFKRMKIFGVLMFLVFFATPQFSHAKTAISIFCYECTVRVNSTECPSDAKIVNCTFPEHRSPFCYKKALKDEATHETELIVTRGCGLRIYAHISPTTCQRRNRQYVWPCDTDKCNAAQSIFSFGTMLILIMAAAISTWIGVKYF